MMYMPSIFGENLFDDWMDSWDNFDRQMNTFLDTTRRNPVFGKNAKNLMKTDVRETKTGYEVDVDLPGFKKDEIKIELENGYLTISAQKGIDKEEKNKEDGHYIRKERYSGAMQRSFYVGDALKQEDISAKFEDGILKLSIPKKEAQEAVPEKKYIAIE